MQFLGDPEYIDDSAFSLCPGMVDENWFVIIKNILFNYYGEEKDVVIPSGVTAIGRRAVRLATHPLGRLCFVFTIPHDETPGLIIKGL